MFESWTDEQFIPWLAGFFDGEGCIYLPEGAGAEISIANTEQAAIEGIRDRLSLGIVNAVTHSQQNWKTKYHWRLRNYPEIYVVLSMIRPYLVIKQEKADLLLERAHAFIAERQACLERNRQIYEMSRTHKQKDVAEQFGLCRQAVKYITDNYGRPRSSEGATATDASQTQQIARERHPSRY